MYINENLSALDAWRNLVNTENNLSTVITQLSSGLRINSPADDPSGYAISQQMQTQVNGYNQAQQNAQDGISLIQTANGALNQAMAILQNMRQLAVEASNGTTTPQDRVDIQNQVDQLAAELTQLSQTTQFNGMNLLNGSFGTTPITLQIGANGTQQDTLSFNLQAVDAQSLGVARGEYSQILASSVSTTATVSAVAADGTNGDLSMFLYQLGTTFQVLATVDPTNNELQLGLSTNGTSFIAGTTVDVAASGTVVVGNENNAQAVDVTVTSAATAGITGNTILATFAVQTFSGSDNLGLAVVTVADAQNAINTISQAIQQVSNEQALIGAVQDRLNYTISLLGAASDNITAAQSRITGVDMAKETALFTQYQILLQSGTQMLYQANQIPTAVLNLLR